MKNKQAQSTHPGSQQYNAQEYYNELCRQNGWINASYAYQIAISTAPDLLKMSETQLKRRAKTSSGNASKRITLGSPEDLNLELYNSLSKRQWKSALTYIDRGAKVTLPHQGTLTCLHHALFSNDISLCEKLYILKPEDLFLKSDDGSTPLHFIAKFCSDELLKWALSKNPNPMALSNGELPYDLATSATAKKRLHEAELRFETTIFQRAKELSPRLTEDLYQEQPLEWFKLATRIMVRIYKTEHYEHRVYGWLSSSYITDKEEAMNVIVSLFPLALKPFIDRIETLAERNLAKDWKRLLTDRTILGEHNLSVIHNLASSGLVTLNMALSRANPTLLIASDLSKFEQFIIQDLRRIMSKHKPQPTMEIQQNLQ